MAERVSAALSCNNNNALDSSIAPAHTVTHTAELLARARRCRPSSRLYYKLATNLPIRATRTQARPERSGRSTKGMFASLRLKAEHARSFGLGRLAWSRSRSCFCVGKTWRRSPDSLNPKFT